MNTDDPSLNKLSERIVGCAFAVSNATALRLRLLMNFPRPRVEVKRIAL
jgi:hypothetical protein